MTQLQVRPLGALEKVFWMLDQNSQVHFVMAVEINSCLPSSEWRTALNAVQQRHPLLSVAIESNGYVNPVFVTDPQSTQIPMRVVSENTERWETEMETELAQPFDWSVAPLIRAVLVQQQQSTVLILAAHHAIADGISLSFVLRDTLLALAGYKLEQLEPSRSIDQLLRMEHGIFFQDNSTGLNNVIITRKPERRPQIKKISLPSSLTNKLVARSKAEATTVHGALAASLVMAARKKQPTWNTKPIRMVHPVSVRNSLQSGEGAGLYINSKIIIYQPDDPKSFWELARYTKEELANSNSKEAITERTNALQEKVFSNIDTNELSAALQKTIAREIMLTNIGRIPHATDFGNFGLNAVWGPAVLSGFPGDQTIGVTTTSETMHIMHVSRSPLPDLLTAVADELISACQ